MLVDNITLKRMACILGLSWMSYDLQRLIAD